MIIKNKEKTAMLMVLICASMWSIAGLFIKKIDWNPLAIAGFRSFFAGLTTFVFMLFKKEKIIINQKTVISMLALSFTFFAFVASNKFTTSANAIALQFTSTTFVLLYGLIFKKQKCRLFDILTVIITTLGIVLFVIDGLEKGNILGNFFGLLAGFFMASMYITVGELDEKEKMSGIVLGQFMTAIIGIPFAFIFSIRITLVSASSIIILGIVQLGIPYILLALATKNCPPLACSLISVAEPLLNPVWVAIFAKEYPSVLSIIGGIIVIFTVSVWCVLNSKIKN